MYSLLIVDDMPDIVDWLCSLFWEDTSLDLQVYKAYSGEEALDYLNSRKIDIVLSDIRMPGINGLQLLENIKRNWPVCKVIFLTAYNEFDYIYTANRYGDVSYILKTEEDEVIIKAVEKAVSDIERQIKDVELLAKAREHMNAALPILQKEFMTDILQGTASKEEINRNRFTELKIALDCEADSLVLLGYIHGTEKLPTMEWIQYSNALNQIINELIPDYFLSYPISVEKSLQAWIFQLKHAEGDEAVRNNRVEWANACKILKGMLELAQKSCRESLDVTVSFVLDTEPVSLNEIHQRYNLVKDILNDGMILGTEIILTDKSYEIISSGATVLENNDVYVAPLAAQKLEFLKTYLERGQRGPFFSLLESMTECLKEVKSMHSYPAMEVYYSIANVFLSYINRLKLSEKLAFKTGLYKLMRVDQHETWKDAVQYLLELGEHLFDIRQNENTLRTEYVIENIKKYIEDNLGEDLSLDALAEKAYFNPSYLSRLFKQVTGIKLSDYIIEMKIKKSKEFLENEDIKIQDIADAVGFSSPRYFTHFFKSYTGLTPHEYRSMYKRSK
ncbi:MAG TPA: AraC family transcriptional regulator [Clostridiaceae bacterium]|nr:AraC family transcriptional regulator [Clostridiaceae bacterium]